MAATLSVAEFAELEGLEKQQVLNRIHRKKIRGARKRGWFWRVPITSLSAEAKAKLEALQK